MGQQQLLLLVLGIVIVGLAVVAGINAFDENQTKSSQDALTQEAFRLATDAKAWYSKPTQFDGGGSAATNVESGEPTWTQIGVDDSQLDNNSEYETPWGTIAKTQGDDGSVSFQLKTSNGGSFGEVNFTPGHDPEMEFDRSVDQSHP